MNSTASKIILQSNRIDNKQTKKKHNSQIFKFLLIILAILLLDIALHQIANLIRTDPNLPREVAFQKMPYIILIMTGFFTSIGLGFLVVKDSLPGSHLQKATIFGILNGFLWFISFYELPVLFNHDIYIVTIGALADTIPVFILIIVLGSLYSKNDITNEKVYFKKNSIVIAIIFSVAFTLGRYFTFLIGNVVSTNAFIGAYYTKPLETVLWTLIFGLSVGFLYAFILPAVKQKSWTLYRTILIFVTIIFGFQWILYTLFFPIIIDESFLITDALIRSLCDCLFFSVAIILIHRLDNKL